MWRFGVLLLFNGCSVVGWLVGGQWPVIHTVIQ